MTRILPLRALALASLALAGCDQAAAEDVQPEPAAEAVATPLTASATPAPAPPKPEPRQEPTEPEAEDGPGLDPRGEFLGERDLERRRALATEPVAEIELGRGGRSVAFKITLEDGTQGYYKPEQTFSAAHWYSEVAAYYLDRALGIGRVPPTVGRRMRWAPLKRVARHHKRLDEVVVQDDGTVRGAFIWWIPGGLDPIAPGHGWERWLRHKGGLAISPYQRPYDWKADLDSFRDTGKAPAPPEGEPAPPEAPEALAAALSDMIVFDFLTRNVDRWGGKFTNVRTRADGGPLVFLDNGAGFGPGRHRIGYIDALLHSVQKFRRATISAIRRLDLDALRQRMASDPLAPILDEHRWEGLAVRRRHVLEHVDAMVERHGEAATYAW